MAVTRWLWRLAPVPVAATAAWGQSVRGTVLATPERTPIVSAAIVARHGKVAAVTDRLGRFALDLAKLPDTLVVTAIGYRPDTVAVAVTDQRLTILLTAAPVALSDLIAIAPAAQTLDLARGGRWQMPMEAARTVPPAVETDVYRALAMIPAASFTSPLSARPMIRGYDAQEVVTRIDGFEVLNLFHLGRVFSSYPADAAEDLSVTVAPSTSTDGGSVAGIIDISGRTGPADRTTAGGGFSFGSFSAFAGGGSDRLRYFGNARIFHLGTLRFIPGVDIPYHFEDGYGSLVIGPPERPRGRITVFATQDRAGEQSRGDFLNWDNVVLGTRWRALDRARTTLEVAGSVASFREDGERVPEPRTFSQADIRNRFRRMTVAADLSRTGLATRVAAGGTVGWRGIANRITESFPSGSPPFQQALVDVGQVEWGGYLEGTGRLGPLALEAAVRLDGAGATAMAQPRLHARWSPAGNVGLSAAVGRTGRLYHLLGEARSEPDLSFLDFWMSAGDSVPAARVDHATLDLDVDLAPIVARISAYASSGTGIGEVRPEYDARPRPFGFFRFGRSRTRGLEIQLAVRGTAARSHALSVSYAWARADRDWGEGWVRWAQDRRHQLRVFGQARLGRLTVFGVAEAATGMPATAVLHRFSRDVPGFDRDDFGDGRAFGPENAVHTSGTFRVDGGFNWTIGRRGKGRLILGMGILNLLQTAVAPIGLDGEGTQALDQTGAPTAFRRLFDLPGLPTFTIRLER